MMIATDVHYERKIAILESALARVRRIHAVERGEDGYEYCRECLIPVPCPTLEVLDEE